MNKYYHVTVLSNFLSGFDKYKRAYDKSMIKESSYPDVFFLLKKSNLHIGIRKANKLLAKLDKPGNRLIVIETIINSNLASQNNITDTLLGEYIDRSWINVKQVYYWNNNTMIHSRIEDLVAESYKVNNISNKNYSSLIPRSISFLPVAKGCQAKCAFCFSAASISIEQKQTSLSERTIHSALRKASAAGASRAVITGGGEPGLLSKNQLARIISLSKQYLNKVVLITNGYALVKDREIDDTLFFLADAGLSVLSVSRHHHNREINSQLMNLDIDSERIANAISKIDKNLILRWICVLQKGGIDSYESLQDYIDWTFNLGVSQICFKELYVSSSSESIYFNKAANDWSYKNQVPLSLVTEMAVQQGWELLNKLPWGSPVYRVRRGKQSITIASYTEPTVSWELANKQCRSWNVMADGKCFASLESRESIINLEDSANKHDY